MLDILPSILSSAPHPFHVFPLHLFCFLFLLLLVICSTLAARRRRESTSNAPLGKSGKIRRRRQSWLMQCCTPRQYCVVDNACLCICIFVFLSLCICINPGLCSAVHQGNGGLLTHRQYGNKKQRQRGNRGMWLTTDANLTVQVGI